jgi:hypothetical protein
MDWEIIFKVIFTRTKIPLLEPGDREKNNRKNQVVTIIEKSDTFFSYIGKSLDNVEDFPGIFKKKT